VTLFNQHCLDQYQAAMAAGVARIAASASASGPWTGVRPEQLAPAIDGRDLDRPLGDVTAALDELEEDYLRDAVHFHHPRYLAHFNPPVAIPALLGEVMLTALNTSMDTWDQSAGATLIERRLIAWTADRIGFEAVADGIFTSGGSHSTLHALLLARQEALAGAHDTQPRPRLRVLASDVGHFSVVKAAMILGLEPDAVIPVATDAARRMRPDALARQIDHCAADGQIVMAVVATAGTTNFGSIDPVAAVAEVCERFGVWLHVDAAYGCGLLVSPTRRHLLAGIERADSVTVDFHKSYFQPISSSAMIVRDRAMLRHVTYHADYLNPRTTEHPVPNQVDISIQATRRFDALKLWLTLRVMGPDAIGALFDQVCDLAADAYEMVRADPRFEAAGRSDLSTLVFRVAPAAGDSPEQTDAANRRAREALTASGEAVIGGVLVDGRQYLKFTLLNPETTITDLADVLDLIAKLAAAGTTPETALAEGES
jgi:L-2,4-diaminobutyrate decarboxylase